MNKHDFENDLRDLINTHCRENGSDTPDYLLAEYLVGCLNAYDRAVRQRDDWVGRPFICAAANGARPAMTDAQIREALIGVLEADGWAEVYYRWGTLYGYPPGCTIHGPGKLEVPPRYDRDLNAIVERVGRLDETQRKIYLSILSGQVLLEEKPQERGYGRLNWLLSQAKCPLRLWALYQTITEGRDG